mgnify:FL=1
MISQKLPRTRIVLPTNGSLVDEQATKKLCEILTLRIINFSVNAYFDETYKAFMGLPPETKDRIYKAIQTIKVLRPDILIRVSIVFDPMYQTDLERDLFYLYWKKVAEVWVLPAASAGRPEKQPCNPVIVPCGSLFSDIVIGFDGKLSSCCFDSGFRLDCGVYTGDLKADWNNKQLQELRAIHNAHKRDTIPLCRSCTFGCSIPELMDDKLKEALK